MKLVFNTIRGRRGLGIVLGDEGYGIEVSWRGGRGA